MMTGRIHSDYSDELLAETARHDVDAFSELVSRYEERLLRYIQRISYFSREEAEEVLQEVCLKAWKNLNDFDEKLKFSSWIYRIAHNETITEYRKSKSRGHENKVEWDEDLLGAFPDNINLPFELDEKMKKEKVREILGLMPEKYREILILKFLEERSYEEISDILRIPPGTVAALISRGKNLFRETAERHRVSFSPEL